MYKTISNHIKQASFFMYIFGSSKEDMIKTLKNFIEFLETEPDKSFKKDSMENIPSIMFLTPEAENRFKQKIPEMHRGGKAGMDKFNILYTLGQYLIALFSAMFVINLKEKTPEGFEAVEKTLKPLNDLWHKGDKGLSVSLMEEYNGKSTTNAKKELIEKINKTIEILNNL